MRLFAALVALVAVLATNGASARRVPAFAHAVVIVFENKDQQSIIGSREAPTFTALARRYAQLTQYYGVTHPSLPNYIALVSGSAQGISDDCTDCIVSAPNLVDSLDAARKTWKLYAEGLPSRGFTGAFSGRYAKKHVPFLYFKDIVDNPARLNRVVPLTELTPDIRARKLPNFAFVVPDMCHSMHDCSIAAGDAWLKAIVPRLLKLKQTVVFVVFDEGTSNDRGGGHLPALALGTAVRAHARFTAVTNHYGLLRTIEDAWRLPRLGDSAKAGPIVGIWR
jgi:acid phosphatase